LGIKVKRISIQKHNVNVPYNYCKRPKSFYHLCDCVVKVGFENPNKIILKIGCKYDTIILRKYVLKVERL